MLAAELRAKCVHLTLWGQTEDGTLEWVGKTHQHQAAKIMEDSLLGYVA